MSISDAELAQCTSSRNDCFASDPEALDSMRYVGDAGIQSGYMNIAQAASEAGAEGIPFEQAVYPQTFILDDGGAMGRGEPAFLQDLENKPGEDDKISYRIAKCAYACGASAVSNCPLSRNPI